MKLLFVFLIVLPFSLSAQECEKPKTSNPVSVLENDVFNIEQKLKPTLIEIESEIAEGKIFLNLDQEGNILNLEMKSDASYPATYSVKSINEGAAITMFDVGHKNPFIIEKHKKSDFDAKTGGILNVKVLESRAPHTPLLGALTRSYRNYRIEVKKVAGVWKVYFDKEPKSRIVLYPRYSAWGWDEVFAGIDFK